ncbi:hypothetical protein PFISCL1PPCAC_26434, partial [Pristionchus fissidentatus]
PSSSHPYCDEPRRNVQTYERIISHSLLFSIVLYGTCLLRSRSMSLPVSLHVLRIAVRCWTTRIVAAASGPSLKPDGGASGS